MSLNENYREYSKAPARHLQCDLIVALTTQSYNYTIISRNIQHYIKKSRFSQEKEGIFIGHKPKFYQMGNFYWGNFFPHVSQ